MFEGSLFDTAGHLESHLGWATVTSVTLQCFLMAVSIMIPLAYTDALPAQQLVTMLVAPPPPPPPPPPVAAPATSQALVTEVVAGRLLTPTRIPDRIEMVKDEQPVVGASTGVLGGVPGGVPGGQLSGVIGGIVSSAANQVFVPKLPVPVVPVRVRVSEGVSEGMLIHQVMPVYPTMARVARISGNVVLEAVISRDGSIQDVKLVSGHPMLVSAAMEAVKQWTYRPYLLNHEPVEVETVITVKFVVNQQ